jgi:hypothetical protein
VNTAWLSEENGLSSGRFDVELSEFLSLRTSPQSTPKDLLPALEVVIWVSEKRCWKV